jgi:hypothetical protein
MGKGSCMVRRRSQGVCGENADVVDVVVYLRGGQRRHCASALLVYSLGALAMDDNDQAVPGSCMTRHFSEVVWQAITRHWNGETY